jgi:hypothetical protein
LSRGAFLLARDSRHIARPEGLVPWLHRNTGFRGAKPMTKFYSLIAAAAVFMPFAFATATQAAQIVA